ncbi:MAG: lysophospholipid acyltransferase family protein [Gemmatimonadetes bacterium]|nr:lysophospholipid acyltransferase family protein [Gemmatimonadota bacterium]
MLRYVPPIADALPRRGNAFSAFAGRLALRAAGWRFEGTIPDVPKLMFVVAPHTSNWDFMLGVTAMFALGIRVTFLGKDTLFRWPLGVLMRWLGGIPVYRHAPRNVVEQTVDHVRQQDRIALGLSPEGTRRKLPAWRTGFHYVARGAGIPIVPVALDYSTRTIRFFAPYTAADSVEADHAALGPLFSAQMARHPAQY